MDQPQKSILGFDIVPMSSPQRKEGVRVSASVLFKDGTKKEWSEIGRKKLLKIINENKVDIVGTDNPYEIIGEGESIASFCERLPPHTEFIHVNLTSSGNTIPLKSLLSQHNITQTNAKLSSVKTARAIITLISKGVGMVLEPFENETLIKVGKPSSSPKGGWSQSRYQRQAEEVVGREANKIKGILKHHKISFDEIIHSTKYGAKMARFHVFSTKNQVDRLFDNVSFYPAKVRIWSPQKSVITHRPIDSSIEPYRSQFYNHLQRLIVGLDPGMTTGVAIGNLNGSILSVFSRKNLSKGQLVNEIAKFGIPVLICADVTPAPAFVSKFASTYNAEIFAPNVELSKIDKRHLANKANYSQRMDSHGRDALASVIRAYQQLDPHFKKINTTGLTHKQKDLAKGMIIRGVSVKDAIESINLLSREKEKIEPLVLEQQSEPDKQLISRLSNLLEDIGMAEEIIGNLRAHASRVEMKNQSLEIRNKKLREQFKASNDAKLRQSLNSEIVEEKDRQIQFLRKKINERDMREINMTQRINDLEEMLWISLDNDGYPVKILQKFSHDDIENLRNSMGINDGDILLIRDPTGGGPQTAQNLATTKIKFIFTEGNDLPKPADELFYSLEIPVLRSEKYGIRITNYLGLINIQNFLQAQDDYNNKIARRKEDERSEKILKTIENYQYERDKQIKDSFQSYDDYEPVGDSEL